MALTTSAILSLFAGAAGGIGNYQEGLSAKKHADFQAMVNDQQARREKDIAAQEERGFRKTQAANLAQLRAAQGGSGTESGSGTALLAASDFDAETELNALRIREGGDIRAERLEQQAQLSRMAGKSVQRGGYYRAGSSLLSGTGWGGKTKK